MLSLIPLLFLFLFFVHLNSLSNLGVYHAVVFAQVDVKHPIKLTGKHFVSQWLIRVFDLRATSDVLRIIGIKKPARLFIGNFFVVPLSPEQQIQQRDDPEVNQPLDRTKPEPECSR